MSGEGLVGEGIEEPAGEVLGGWLWLAHSSAEVLDCLEMPRDDLAKVQVQHPRVLTAIAHLEASLTCDISETAPEVVSALTSFSQLGTKYRVKAEPEGGGGES